MIGDQSEFISVGDTEVLTQQQFDRYAHAAGVVNDTVRFVDLPDGKIQIPEALGTVAAIQGLVPLISDTSASIDQNQNTII